MNRNAVLQKMFEPERRSGAFRLNSTTAMRLLEFGLFGLDELPLWSLPFVSALRDKAKKDFLMTRKLSGNI
jgi:hypothetical protein